MAGLAVFWGDLIKQLRLQANLSQREFSVLAKVNRATLRRIEAGEPAGDITTIERCLTCLGYELDAIQVDAAEVTHQGENDDNRRSRLAGLRVLSIRLDVTN